MQLALAAAALALVSAACTTLPHVPVPGLLPEDSSCHAWVTGLAAAVAAAGVADAESEPITGYPGLRVDRVLDALRDEAGANEAAFAAWLARAAALDRAARAAEIGNLPDTAFPLGPVPGRAEALARSEECRERVAAQLLGKEGAATQALRTSLLERATVPQRYSLALRALGLYPLARWPFLAGVQGWQDAHRADMARWASAPPPLHRYVPAGGEGGHSSVPPDWPPAADALGLPQPTEAQARQLLAWHAPAFEVEERGAFDRFGTPAWDTGADPRPRVAASAPVIYQRIAHTRLAGRWQLQLVYTLWFDERPARSNLDLLAGALDGVIVRLTLGDDGQPLLMDTIHACGCYHLFFPAPALRLREGAPRHEEWLFAPAPLPAPAATERLVVRIASATHYVSGVGRIARDGHRANAAGGIAPAAPYALHDEQALRSLPWPGTSPPQRRSLYGPNGLVAGSERGERFLFWPMGIASAGAMRQWGHHATAFVGRRHFDEVDLIERRFELAPR